MRGPVVDALHWMAEWVKSPGEGARHLSNSPTAFPARSEVLDSSLTEICSLLGARDDLSKLNYSAVVGIVLSHIRRRACCWMWWTP